MTSLSVSMPAALSQWVATRLAEGRYANAAEYVRDLVRRDFEDASLDRRWLKAMIDEGLASEVIDREPEDILAEIIAEDPDLRD